MRLHVKEAALRSCVRENAVRGWLKAGQLPHYRLGLPGRRGTIVIEVEDLDGLHTSFKVGKKEPERKALPVPKAVLKHLRIS
jgi:hypothetical protein